MSAARDSLVFRVSNQRLMRRQGIGFSVHGVVVDRKTLSRIFFLVMGTVGKQGSSLGCCRSSQGAAAQVLSVPSSSRCGRRHHWTWLWTSAP